jgi:hypothetical protein
MGSSSEEIVSGKALLEAAIAEAELRVVGLDGGLLAASRQELGEQGVFSLAVAGLPADFRFEIEDLSSREVLRAEVRGYEPGWTLVFVSSVSTLVSAYLGRHPDSSVEAATSAVKAHLGIPESADLAYDLADARLPSFDLAAFQADARSRGGLAAQVPELLDQIDAGAGPATFLPATPRLRGDFGSELLTNFAGGLAASAAQKVASSLGAPGWMMSLLGGKDEDAIKNRLDDITKALGQQKQLLTEVHTQIGQLGTEVTQTLAQLAAAAEKNTYELGANLLLGPIAEIKALGTLFRYLFELDLQNPGSSLANRKAKVAELQKKARTQVWIRLTQLHDVLVGTAAVEGLIPLWVRVVGRNHAGFPNFVDHVVLDAAHRQLDLYAGHQLTGLQILIEAYHAETPINSRLAERAWKSLAGRLRQQLEQVGGPANLDDRLIVDRRSSLMWTKKGAADPGSTKPAPLAFSYSVRLKRFVDGRDPLRFTADFKVGEYGGWRLPTREEIVALVRDKTGRLGEWLDSQGFRVKDQDAPPYNNFFLVADGARAGSDVGEWTIWDAFTGNFKKVKEFNDLVVMRVFPVRPVWPDPPRALKRGGQLGGLLDSGLRFLAKKIATGAGSKIGGEATGWILRRLGANTDDPVIGQADAIRAELAEQKQLIQRIGADVAVISRRVGELKRELLDLGDQGVYDTAARALQLQISKITAIHELLGWMAEADPTVSNKADAEALLLLIDSEILTALEHIDLALMSAADREGLLAKWRRRTANRMVPGWTDKTKDPDPKKLPQFLGRKFLDVINDQWEYYYAAQVLGLQLLVEAEHASGGAGLAVQMVRDFSARIVEQEKEILGPRVPEGFIYNNRSKSHWATAPLCPSGHGGADCRFELAPGGAFPRGTPAAALAAFAAPAGFDCRLLSEADLVGLPDTASANTFREVFTKAGFEESFDLPIWLAGATAQKPSRLNGRGEVEHGVPAGTLRFTVLPVCTAKPDPA